MTLAYLPQGVTEVGGVAILVAAALIAAPLLIFGRSSAYPTWPATRVRLVGAAGIAFGGLLALASFLVPAGKPPRGLPSQDSGSYRWADVFMIIGLSAVAAWNVAREVRFLRSTGD